MIKRRHLLVGLMSSGAAWTLPTFAQTPADLELILASYPIAKPLFARLIPEFQKEWKEKTGQTVIFNLSYGGSFQQTRAILGGLEADIFAINTQAAIEPLVAKGLVKANWKQRLPNSAVPASSVMVLITRPGNPKNIHTWQDLVRPGVGIVAINPKTSGNARWGILAGYGAILKTQGEPKAQEYLKKLVKNAKTFTTTGREASDILVKNNVGDVLINFENEIIYINEVIPRDYPYTAPSPNIRADFPATVVDSVVDKRGTRKVAEAFTQFLFSPKAQEIYANLGYRPHNQNVFKKYIKQYQTVPQLYTINDFGGWKQVNQKLFEDGALFDQAQQTAQGKTP